jgi:hypothetical protein
MLSLNLSTLFFKLSFINFISEKYLPFYSFDTKRLFVVVLVVFVAFVFVAVIGAQSSNFGL